MVKSWIIYLKSSTSACFDEVASELPSITTTLCFSKNMHSENWMSKKAIWIQYRSWQRDRRHGHRHQLWFLRQARGGSPFQFGSNSELGGALRISKIMFENNSQVKYTHYEIMKTFFYKVKVAYFSFVIFSEQFVGHLRLLTVRTAFSDLGKGRIDDYFASFLLGTHEQQRSTDFCSYKTEHTNSTLLFRSLF